MPAKTPPAALVTALNRLRGALDRLHKATVPSHIAMLELALGSWFTAALYGAVQLGIADALAHGPLTADDVARRVDAHPEATFRLMRTLASRGVLKLRRDGRFQLTRLGQALRSDHPESMAPMLRFVGSRQHWEHWGHLTHSVRTGHTAVGHLRGLETFDYLETDPEFAAIFDAAMTGSSRAVLENAVPAYDFGDARLIVDVGGGQGALLSAVLQRAPQATGVLFDRAPVVASADSVLRAAGVADRCTVTGGDFFASVPDGGDVYLLKAIVHDWDDDRATAILRNVRTAIADGGRVLLWELVLPEGAPSHLGFMIDLEMLVSAGGRERTARQYERLLADAGFRMTKVVPTASPLSIVEAVPA